MQFTFAICGKRSPARPSGEFVNSGDPRPQSVAVRRLRQAADAQDPAATGVDELRRGVVVVLRPTFVSIPVR